jgi:hypothetical protein
MKLGRARSIRVAPVAKADVAEGAEAAVGVATVAPESV